MSNEDIKIIDNLLKDKNYIKALQKCDNLPNLKTLLSKCLDIPFPNLAKDIKVKLYCNWTTTKELTEIWSKMSKGNGRWKNIILTEDRSDYNIVINKPNIDIPENEYKKTIIFQMEPNMKDNNDWGEWANPDPNKFFKIFTHLNSYNNIEWHLSTNYEYLSTKRIEKDLNVSNILSTVLSNKYFDPGHIKRVDFIKYLDANSTISTHVFGFNRGYKNYKGPLPYHCKDLSMFPYKYVFNVENNFITNYFTEKLIDGILSESLVFYHGCPNISNFFDKRSFVWLDLEDFEKDMKIIETAITEDWYTQRLPYIKKMKRLILEEYQFFPRIYNILINNKCHQD